MINAWNRMCALDDEFVARFISIFNIGVSFITILSLWMLGAFNNDSFAQLKGSYMNTLNYSSSSFGNGNDTLIINLELIILSMARYFLFQFTCKFFMNIIIIFTRKVTIE